MSDSYGRVDITSAKQWRDWLQRHHRSTPGVWVVTYKKRADAPYVPYGEIVDEAIAYGWVDSQPRTLDAARSMRLLTPRRPTANWSRVNKARALLLSRAGDSASPPLPSLGSTGGRPSSLPRFTGPG